MIKHGKCLALASSNAITLPISPSSASRESAQQGQKTFHIRVSRKQKCCTRSIHSHNLLTSPPILHFAYADALSHRPMQKSWRQFRMEYRNWISRYLTCAFEVRPHAQSIPSSIQILSHLKKCRPNGQLVAWISKWYWCNVVACDEYHNKASLFGETTHLK